MSIYVPEAAAAPPGTEAVEDASACWLSTRAVAERLGVTSRTVYRLINDGELIAHRFGRVIRVRVEDLGAFVAGSRIEPGGLEHLVSSVSKGRSGARSAVVDTRR